MDTTSRRWFVTSCSTTFYRPLLCKYQIFIYFNFLHKILERTYSNVTRWSCEAIVELALYRPPPERNTIHSSKNFNEMLINVNKLSSLMTALIKNQVGEI